MRMLVILGLVLSMSVTENSFADGGRDGDYYREFGQSIGRYFRNKYGRGHEKRSKETLKGKRVRIDLDGSDYREVKVDAEQVKVRFSGSGELVITGRTEELIIDGSGSADIDARDLKAENVEIDVSGSADVRAYATRNFDLYVTGSADVHLYGKGSIKRRKVSGSARVYDRRDED